ncbi:MAG: symmetrical bis(5'-nucleosyl)-tetraphosphatase [Pseudomonadota bacterium]
MATYAIGDIQGCFASFERLLERIDFKTTRDRLWLVGDLVNRGPASLKALRWVFVHRDIVTLVLGNHDLHLLALALGVRAPRKRDSLDEVLAAPDRDLLIEWLRHQPVLHRTAERVMVHAGLLPAWSVTEAATLAREIELELQGEGAAALLEAYEKEAGRAWSPALKGRDRLVVALTALTRLRSVDLAGVPLLDEVGPPAVSEGVALPWFRHPAASWRGTPVLFGHWAALGLHLADGVQGLDSACVWGARLTALRLDDGALFQVDSVES